MIEAHIRVVLLQESLNEQMVRAIVRKKQMPIRPEGNKRVEREGEGKKEI